MSARLSRARGVALVAGASAFIAMCAFRAVRASAPEDQYDEFTRSSTEIGDLKTQLMWRRAPASGLGWTAAKNYCTNIAPLGTYRLPTIKELLTLVDEDAHPEYIGTRIVTRYLDQAAFGGYADQLFWSSTQEGTFVFTLNAESGAVSLIEAGPTVSGPPLSVRCVKKF